MLYIYLIKRKVKFNSIDNMSNIFSKNKWISTVASIWIQSVMGGTYAFSVYSPILKSLQSYDQSTLDTVSVFKDIGSNAGVLAGFLYTAFENVPHYSYSGPWLILAMGSVLCFMGYFFIWLSVVGPIPRPPVPVMCLFMFIAAQSQTFFNTANVVTGVLNFPDYSGTIVGILKAFLGLTGAILIQLYQSFFAGKASTFILMLAFLPSTVSVSLMFLVKIYPENKVDDRKHLIGFSLISLALAAYLMIIVLFESIFEFPSWAHFLIVLLLLFMLSLPVHIAMRASRKEISHPPVPAPVEREPFLHGKESGQTSEDIIGAGENMNILQAICSFNFWLLFVSVLCGMGSGLATINNISQIGESLGYNAIKVNTLISVWSVWNVLGRVGAGYLSDMLLREKGWARPSMMAITLATMTWGHVIIASDFQGNLYIGTVLIGISYGAQWSLMPTITSEIFGVLHMGTIYNAIAIANPLGTCLLSVWVIGYLYDKEAKKEAKSCTGLHCFNTSFFILASFSFFGFFLALTLFIRTRVFYRSVIQRRLCRSLIQM
ncbi:protein NUCLEAR FUSION DEFECTIVE 4-like [Silene latifolia]|uniref:protein NUCLEAR FUSION DEFECTIVE 4-like n=1 Tax=Silene latifolia TaxID=37657 RepID=UPI003D776D5D